MRSIRHRMVWHILPYGIALAALAVLLDWLDFRRVAHQWSSEFYVLCIALVFVAFGIWLGNRLTPRPRTASFTRNDAAMAALGISKRELQVLEELADGASNKLIARRLNISPNTVKTHVARLFERLKARNRTEAIAKARALGLLP